MRVSKIFLAIVAVLIISEEVYSRNHTRKTSLPQRYDWHSFCNKSEVTPSQNRTRKLLHNSSNNTFSQDLDATSGRCKTNDDCAPWMKCRAEICVCNQSDWFHGKLICEEHTGALSVLDCHCMTYDNETGHIEVGACIENCMNVSKHLQDQIYHQILLPNYENIASLNNKTCGVRFHREGRLCGKCQYQFRPQAYSFNMTCVSCPEGNLNLWKYFVAALAPLTCFYFIVLFFKINTTTSHLHGFVLFAQSVVLPQFARLIILTSRFKPSFDFPIKLMGSLYGFWNLDFFRAFQKMGTCLDMSPLSVLALDYIIAFYPFFLTVLSYILIELHDRNFKILVFIWRPFRCIFTLFRRQWDIRTSVIDAYATFYSLSCFKILCITFDILIPTYLYTVGESGEGNKLVVYYDASIDFFGPEHLPYAIPAIFIALFSVILPILLLLVYPCRCFQHLLSRCGHIHSHIFHTFMDSFQGCYKNGTEPGTRDCRYFAGIYLLFRVILYIVFSFTLGSMYFPLATVGILLLVILLANARPYKENVAHYNNINMTFLCILAVFYSATIAMNIASIKAKFFIKGCYLLSLIVCFIPLLYMFCISIHWIFSRRRWGRTFLNRVRAWRRGYDWLEESLPDRLVNPDQYSAQSLADTVKMTDECESHSGVIHRATY